MTQRNRYVVGMDGGGTKTAAMITDGDGTILAEHIAGPSNFQIMGVEKAAKTLYQLLADCADSAGCSFGDIRAVTIGLTGAGRPVDQERMAKGFRSFALSKKTRVKKITIESDARIALEGAFKGDPGIILIAGTGSIAFGKDADGCVHRVGGWGRVLGDEGSGYFIGRSALTAVTRHIDGRSHAPALAQSLAKEFGLQTQTDIITAVYRNNFDIATIAPIVLRLAEKKDPVSSEIISIAVKELVQHVGALWPKLHVTGRKKVKNKTLLSFIGGLIANETVLSRLLIEAIEAHVRDIMVISPMAPPVYGACIMALREMKKEITST